MGLSDAQVRSLRDALRERERRAEERVSTSPGGSLDRVHYFGRRTGLSTAISLLDRFIDAEKPYQPRHRKEGTE